MSTATKKITIDFHGRPLSVEVGRVAKQANGAAFIQYGDTVVLVTAVADKKPREGVDFLPLSVDYIERFSAAGKIPGGFFKREGRQTEREILISRLTDRPIRPLFADNYRNETQVIATVFSFDKENESDVLAALGASAALHVSDIPFLGPIATVRVGRIDGKLVCNPTITDCKNSDLDLIVAASRDAIVMVEGEANQVPEPEILEALMFGFKSVQPLLDLQDELRKALGKPKWTTSEVSEENPLLETVRKTAGAKLTEVLSIKEKLTRYQHIKELGAELCQTIPAQDPTYADQTDKIKAALHDVVSSEIRNGIVTKGRRLDGRGMAEIRQITVEVGVLPRTHGSALFTRGETQALVTTTLGTSDDEQRIDALVGEYRSRFMLHYNFPPFSVGEVKFLRGPARREIGHGFLANKSISKVLPKAEDFPYTMRIVSDILESHGSSSMATVCGAALSLMDAGVPIVAPVAGIAMGLVKEGEHFFILSDISGDEDHIGDMDFKVAGTAKGVTGIQMDIKVRGISREILDQALAQAREGRLHILEKMNAALNAPRKTMSQYAPRMETIQIKQDKIREIIGPGGKMIRSIVEQSGAKVDVDDSGKITIASADGAALAKARELIEAIVAEAEIGRVYKGTVRRIMEYGAFVEIMPGTDGLVHISQLHPTDGGRVNNVTDVVQEGDEIEVKVISIDHQGKIKLSQREAVAPGSGNIEAEPQGGGRPRRDDRPRRDGPRPPRNR